jgi:hypothetical protein
MKVWTTRVLRVQLNCDLMGRSLISLIRRQSIFAVSEICKGALILEVGDMVTADQFGEVIVIAWQAVLFCGLVSVALVPVRKQMLRVIGLKERSYSSIRRGSRRVGC